MHWRSAQNDKNAEVIEIVIAPFKKKIPITGPIALSIGFKGTTKICPICRGPVIARKYHVAIRDMHKSAGCYKSNEDGTYDTGNIYVHVECFDDLVKMVKDKMESRKEDIELNDKWSIGANI